MAFTCHPNILRLKRATSDKSDASGKGLVAFVEPVHGRLDSLLYPEQCINSFGYIPSVTLRVSLREIISGLCFLWTNGLYHGNLDWNTTFYNSNGSVKLANFEIQVSKEQGRINDRESLVRMLQHVKSEALNFNRNCSCALIDLLINMLSTIDMASLVGLERRILNNSFFWNGDRKTEFFTTVISIKLMDNQFVRSLPADLCITPWDESYNEDFRKLVEYMDDYRQTIKKWEKYNKHNVKQFVSCICGLYAHKNAIKVDDVDNIITRNVPLLVEKLRRLI